MSLDKSETLYWPQVDLVRNPHQVSAGFRGRGDLEFSGTLVFGGQWSGSIQAKEPGSHLHILPSAQIVGQIRAERVTCEGSLNDVDLETELFFAKKGARVLGRVRAEKIVIEEGALVEGRIVSHLKK